MGRAGSPQDAGGITPATNVSNARLALKRRSRGPTGRGGERTIKVRGKIFAFLSEDGEKLYLTVKLPQSSDAALGLPFTSPTRYRLGRSGWVSARFPKGSAIPLDMFRDWIEESYCAVAPASLVNKAK